MDLTNCNDCSKKISKFLQKRLKIFGKEFTRIKEDYYCEDIHDSRVSSRIILSMLDTLSPLLPKKELKKVSAYFKKFLKSTSNLRDLQVQTMLALLYKDSFPFVSGYASVMDSYTQLAIYQLKKKIHRLDPQKIKDDYTSLVHAINESNLDCMVLLDAINTEITRNASLAKEESFNLDINIPSTLHKYRVKLKILRYSLESFSLDNQQLFPTALIELKAAQSLLGQINDLTIFESGLMQFVSIQKNRDLAIFGKTISYDLKIFENIKSRVNDLFVALLQKKESLQEVVKSIN